MEFAREKEIKWLLENRNQPGTEASVKVIAGLRRAGKTYLLGTLFKNYLIGHEGLNDANICSMDLSAIPDDSIRTSQKLKEVIIDRISKNRKIMFVFVDEVQLAGEGFASVMKTLAKNYPAIDFYVTGSTSELTSTEILTKFGSECPHLLIRPLTYREIKKVKAITVIDYEQFGGIPKVLLCPTEEAKVDALSSLLRDVFINDVVDKVKKLGFDEDQIKRMLEYLLSNVANFTKPETIAVGLAGSTWGRLSASEREQKTRNVSIAIGEINKTYLLEELNQKGLEGKAVLSDCHKHYSVDLGLLNAAMSFHPDVTKQYENAVYLDLVSRGYHVLVEHYQGTPMIKEGKTQPREKEIDFVADKGEQHILVQVSYVFSSEKRFKEETHDFADYAKPSEHYFITESLEHPPVVGVTFLTLEELLNKDEL
jgi:predicted AAA+ superfamily ATPase